MTNGDRDLGDLRPRGSVTVRCKVAGCGKEWWVDPLDPQIHDPNLDCGDDHDGNKVLWSYLERLLVQQGLQWCSMRSRHSDPPPPPLTPEQEAHVAEMAKQGKVVAFASPGCQGFNPHAARVEFTDRTHTLRSEVAYDELSDLLVLRADKLNWQKDPRPWETMPEGKVWGHYVRAYADSDARVFVEERLEVRMPCTRPGCTKFVNLDFIDPLYHAPSSSSGSDKPFGPVESPSWPNIYRCEDRGYWWYDGIPCYITQGPAQRELNDLEGQGIRWTNWRRLTMTFYNEKKSEVGVLRHNGDWPKTFDGKMIAPQIVWTPYTGQSMYQLTGES